MPMDKFKYRKLPRRPFYVKPKFALPVMLTTFLFPNSGKVPVSI